MIKACLCLKHSFFPSSTREKGPFLPSRNNCSIRCIGFRVCPLGFFLKPCSIYHSLLYRHRFFNFLFPLASFLRVGANFRLSLLPLKAFFRPCLPCHHPIALALITHYLLCLSPPFHISAQCRLAPACRPTEITVLLLLLWLSLIVIFQYSGFFVVLLLFVPSVVNDTSSSNSFLGFSNTTPLILHMVEFQTFLEL